MSPRRMIRPPATAPAKARPLRWLQSLGTVVYQNFPGNFETLRLIGSAPRFFFEAGIFAPFHWPSPVTTLVIES